MAKIIFRLTPGESLEFSLHQGATRLGRHHGNQIVINNTWISSLHAEFRRTGGAISVHDLGSSNGTLVNGEVVHERELRDGDRLGFGQLEAIYDAEVEMPSETASMAATPEIADTAGAPGAAISKPLVSKPSPAAEAVVAVSQVAAPPTIVADDTRKKESTRELEVLQKSLAQTTAATARAVQEQAEAEAILFSTRSAVAAAQLALVAAEAPLYDIKQAAETARLAAEAARLAAG